MPVFVYRDNDRVIIETNNGKVVLTANQAKLVLKKLADICGFRLNPLKPEVLFKLESLSLIRIDIHEGKTVKTVVLPVDVIYTYLKALMKLGPGKHSKRKLAKLVMEELVKDKRFKEELEKYILESGFDWEKFFGGRDEYYKYFRTPILVLDAIGLVVEKRSAYIEVTEDILRIESKEELVKRIRKKENKL